MWHACARTTMMVEALLLGALLVEDHHKHVRETTKGAGNRSSALMGIMDIDGMDPTGGTLGQG